MGHAADRTCLEESTKARGKGMGGMLREKEEDEMMDLFSIVQWRFANITTVFILYKNVIAARFINE